MTDAREIIARHLCTMAAQGWSAISPFERAAYRTTAAGMVEAVTTAGFRILGPDEVDPVTVERAARLVEEGKEVRDPLDNYQSTIMDEWPSDDEAAAAIRAMERKDG